MECSGNNLYLLLFNQYLAEKELKYLKKVLYSLNSIKNFQLKFVKLFYVSCKILFISTLVFNDSQYHFKFYRIVAEKPRKYFQNDFKYVCIMNVCKYECIGIILQHFPKVK